MNNTEKALLGLREMLGINATPGPNGKFKGQYSGWGKNYSSNNFISNAQINNLEGAAAYSSMLKSTQLEDDLGLNVVSRMTGKSRLGNIALSGFQTYNTVSDIFIGASQYKSIGGKAFGAATWGLGSWASSSILASSMATGQIGTAGYVGASLVGTAGQILGGPLGQVAGTALGNWAFGAGAATMSTVAGVGMPIVGGAAAVTVGAYYAVKGSYSILKSGYHHRQKMMSSINTAGNTAAFMNRNAFTMRSKAMEAIGNNRNTIQGAFGYEAQRGHYNSYRKLKNTMY